MERLFSVDGEGVDDLVGDLVVSDVERDLARLRQELELLDSIDSPAPGWRVMDDDDLILVSLSVLLDAPEYRWLGPSRDLAAAYWLRRRPLPYAVREAIENSPFETIPIDTARQSLVRRAADFLATRLTAVADGGGLTAMLNLPRRRSSAPTLTPGCNFAVTTNNPGLRVHWSGAYALSPSFFGHPTTPVGGVMQAGRYIFAVDGGAYGNSIQWDTSIVVLPGPPHVHLNF